MPIFIDRINHISWSRAAFTAGVIWVSRLAAIPAVVGALLANINLLPRILADIIDIKLACTRLERETERVAQAPGKRLLAFLCGGAPSSVTARAVSTNERVVGWNTAIG